MKFIQIIRLYIFT